MRIVSRSTGVSRAVLTSCRSAFRRDPELVAADAAQAIQRQKV
jgi:hypothetical protein